MNGICNVYNVEYNNQTDLMEIITLFWGWSGEHQVSVVQGKSIAIIISQLFRVCWEIHSFN